MKNLTFLLLTVMFFAAGCATKYLVKDSAGFSKAEFAANENIGVTVLGNHLPYLKSIIEEDVFLFSGWPQNLRDISQDIVLSAGRIKIENIEELTAKNSDIRYALVVWADEPEISQTKSADTQKETEITKKKNKKKKKEEILVTTTSYTTTYSIKCETMLFDLENRTLIAKAKKNFLRSKTWEESETEDSWSGPLALEITEVMADMFAYANKEEVYPEVSANDLDEKIEGYFYFFLEDIDPTDDGKLKRSRFNTVFY